MDTTEKNTWQERKTVFFLDVWEVFQSWAVPMSRFNRNIQVFAQFKGSRKARVALRKAPVVSTTPTPKPHLPFHQFHGDEVIPISRVEEYKAIRRCGFELKKEVHGCVGLQRGQAQIAVLWFESDRVSDYGSNPEAGIQLTVVNVSVLAEVNVEHAIKSEGTRGTRHASDRVANITSESLFFRISEDRAGTAVLGILSEQWCSEWYCECGRGRRRVRYLRPCRWPMKLDGMLETKRRSVIIPVSMLWNSRRVWSPIICPGDGEGQGKGRGWTERQKQERKTTKNWH